MCTVTMKEPKPERTKQNMSSDTPWRNAYK